MPEPTKTKPQFIAQLLPDGESYTLNVVDGAISDPAAMGDIAVVQSKGLTYAVCVYDIAAGPLEDEDLEDEANEIDGDEDAADAGEDEDAGEGSAVGNSAVKCIETGEEFDLTVEEL